MQITASANHSDDEHEIYDSNEPYFPEDEHERLLTMNKEDFSVWEGVQFGEFEDNSKSSSSSVPNSDPIFTDAIMTKQQLLAHGICT